MNSEQLQQELEAITAEDILPGSIHLWHGVRQSLVAKGLLQTSQGENKMQKINKKHPAIGWVVGLSVTVILLGVFFFVTPQGKVLAQEIVSFFTRGESNQQTINQIEASLEPQPTELVATPLNSNVAVEEGCGTALSPRCSLEEIQVDTPYTLSGFSSLPEGMNFIGATTIPQGVLLEYIWDYGTMFLIESSIENDQLDSWTIGKNASIQSTTVNQYPAEFVQGSWSGLGRSSDVLVWDESIPSRTLRWQAEGIVYTLMYYPAKVDGDPIEYDMDQLNALAETLQLGDDTNTTAMVDQGISLEEAEKKAGYSFNESNQIPAGLTLYQTTYNEEHNSICQYYLGKESDATFPTLVIAQSSSALPTLDEIQTKAFFGDKQIEIGIDQETLPIKGADNEQGSLITTGLQVEAICGGEPLPANRALFWQQLNRSFIVFGNVYSFSGAAYVTKIELQRIAQSLNGVETEIDPSILDPERLLSLKDAEALTGLDILQPEVMLSTLHFNHISAAALQGSPYQIVTEYSNDQKFASRNNRIMIFQVPKATSTLAELKMGGGYIDTTVKGYPAIYRTQCSETPPYGNSCQQEVFWFEGDTEFMIMTYTETIIPQDTLLEIANSMQ